MDGWVGHPPTGLGVEGAGATLARKDSIPVVELHTRWYHDFGGGVGGGVSNTDNHTNTLGLQIVFGFLMYRGCKTGLLHLYFFFLHSGRLRQATCSGRSPPHLMCTVAGEMKQRSHKNGPLIRQVSVQACSALTTDPLSNAPRQP